MRLALGAGRWRVVRQLSVESLVLAVAAAARGLALIIVTARVFPPFPVSAAPVEQPTVSLDPDWRVMAFLEGAAHVAKLKHVFAAANWHRMAPIARVWTGDDSVADPYDARDARTFPSDTRSCGA